MDKWDMAVVTVCALVVLAVLVLWLVVYIQRIAKRVTRKPNVTRPIGINELQLVIRKMSQDTTPPGPPDGPEAVIHVVAYYRGRGDGKLLDAFEAAETWVQMNLQKLQKADFRGAPNPWTNAGSEAVAGEVLRLIKERDDRKA